MTRLSVTDDAEQDLSDILAYLEREASARVASNYAARFKDCLDRLLQFPASGAPRPKLGGAARIAVVHPYILIYDHVKASDELVLLRILHGRRNITKKLIGSRE